ncbi:VPS10 domain-containing receptor SorCS1-like [Sardina pilchardus]|uniref:VPS10 domain-containing receptor SorCS1-like n=1 Tax=Sardina pilchardus TaxID=27697 RepID=UPI002E0F3196
MANSRQDELKLTSSTFALTGDSAHNQAMVHWSGQNSSVILMLTKFYDFNLGSVTESSLWRSTDYGTTYEKLNEKVGVKTILSYLYVSPNNKRKLYSSMEFGRRWQLVHERVAPNRFYWSKMGVDKEAGLIHLETSVSETQALYVTCKLQNCTDGNKGKPFPGYIDPNSLVVQDEYVFVQVTTGGRTIYYVSSQRDVFTPMRLPKYTLPKDLHVISTDEKRVVAAVQEWNQNDTFNLYVSESGGVYYTLALENVMSSMGPEGNVMIDLYEVAGIKGMFLANKKQDNQVKTYITYNKGRDWRLLQAPDADLRGNSIHCMLPYCSLHLHLHVSANPYTSGNIASKESAPGIIMASGSIGAELSSSNVSMFITSDAGNTWRQIFDEEYSVLYLDQGGALVAIRHTPLPIRHLWLSFDEGRLWNKYSFTSSPLFVDGVLGEPGEETLIMTYVLYCGRFQKKGKGLLEHIHLSAPFVAVKNKEVNLTAVLWPSQVGTVTYVWWLGNNSEPVITLDGSVAFTFSREGVNVVTVQVSAGNVILQDRKTIAVHEYFKSHLLAFSSNLDEHNPDVAEWRLDVSRVIRNSVVQATGIDRELLLVTVLPGLPTTAEFFLLPDKQVTEGKPEKTNTHLDELSEMVLGALNQNLVQFTLRPGVQITVYAAHLSAAPLVDTSENHSGSAMLMLLSVVVVGLAIFVIYKFKRKIPGLSVYAQMQNEKEQEMIQSPVSPAAVAGDAVAGAGAVATTTTTTTVTTTTTTSTTPTPAAGARAAPCAAVGPVVKVATRPPRELAASSLKALDTELVAHPIGESPWRRPVIRGRPVRKN